MDSIEAALAALNLQSKPNYTQTANEYGVDRSTLSRRHRNITGSKADGYNVLPQEASHPPKRANF